MQTSEQVPLKVVIAVLTCNRNDLLQDTLTSLVQLTQPSNVSIELLIVDNYPDNSAETVARQVFPALPFPCFYQQEEHAGISFARNRAIDFALQHHAHFLAFLDDDATATSSWLEELLRTQRKFHAHIVMGKIVNDLPRNSPHWLSAQEFFPSLEMRDGQEIYECDTGNALITRQVFADWNLRFDTRFALSGGEDSDYSQQAKRMGARLVYSAAALSHQRILPYKLTVSWLLKRRYRGGCTRARIETKLRSWWCVAPRTFGNGLWTLIQGSVLLLTSITHSKTQRVKALLTCAEGAGLCMGTLGFKFQEYKFTRTRSYPE